VGRHVVGGAAHLVAEQADLDEVAAVEQQRHALARRELAALVVLCDLLGAAHRQRLRTARLELGDAISHRGHGSRYQRARGFASPRRLTYDPAMIWRPLTAIAIVLCTRPAWAQRADAGALFDQGRELMEQGKTAEACAAFEQSMKLDPQRGTLYNLG